MGHIYQQTFIDTYAKVAFTKLYDRKNALVAAAMLNDTVVPFTSNMTCAYYGYLPIGARNIAAQETSMNSNYTWPIEDIDHTKTKAKSPQTNGICERFHRTIPDEFYAIAFRKKIYRSVAELQADLDRWMYNCNNERTHNGDTVLVKRLCKR